MAGSPSNAPEAPSRDFSLSDREVHVWTLRIGVERRAWDHVLSGDEREAAGRMAGEHRLRFRNGRAALRLVLGNYLLEPPGSLQFSLGPHGKPYVPTGRIHFNVSHSGDVLTIAVTRDAEVGIDIEVLRKVDDLPAIAAQFFQPREVERLANMDPSAIDRAFLKLWVRKEAILKAAGIGLADGLAVAVPFEERLQGATACLEGRSDRPQFHLYDLAGDSEFVGAVATCGGQASIVRKTIGEQSYRAMLFDDPSPEQLA